MGKWDADFLLVYNALTNLREAVEKADAQSDRCLLCGSKGDWTPHAPTCALLTARRAIWKVTGEEEGRS